MEKKQKSIDDIVPRELIHRILLRVPAKQVARLRCVSKLWYSLISDPHFAELHFHHSPAATHASIFIKNRTVAHLVYLEAPFSDDNDASLVKVVSPPFKRKNLPSDFDVLGSCRGFVLLHRHPHFLVVWNPLTGSSKRISYSGIFCSCNRKSIWVPGRFHLFGFGYDSSQDDYLLVVALQDKDKHYHLDCFSMRTNSWINLDAALSNPLGVSDSYSYSRGLFLNGAIHWVSIPLTSYMDAILIFDMKERTFSRISGPEQPVMSACTSLALLGGCLVLYYHNNDSCNTDIWVMKEYKVNSSWTLYQIPCKVFQPLCLSNNGDIIGRGYTSDGKMGYLIYNVRGDLLKHLENLCCPPPMQETNTVYTESLLPLLSDIKDKKKEIGHQVRHGYFDQLDVAKG